MASVYAWRKSELEFFSAPGSCNNEQSRKITFVKLYIRIISTTPSEFWTFTSCASWIVPVPESKHTEPATTVFDSDPPAGIVVVSVSINFAGLVHTQSQHTSCETQTHHHCFGLFEPCLSTVYNTADAGIPGTSRTAFREEFGVHLNSDIAAAGPKERGRSWGGPFMWRGTCVNEKLTIDPASDLSFALRSSDAQSTGIVSPP